jgi:MscS family membrane protein
MKRVLLLLVGVCLVSIAPGVAFGADAASAVPEAQAAADAAAQSVGGSVEAQRTAAAAAAATVAASQVGDRPPDFLELLVDAILSLFDIESSGNTAAHYAIAAMLFVISLLARRIVTGLIFPTLQRLAAKTKTTLDDKMFPALETPIAALVMLVGVFASLKVLKLTPEADIYISAGARVAFSLGIFWALWRALSALLDHGAEMARNRGMGVAAFMPWIRKTLLTVFMVLAVLLTIQSMGYDVKALLAGLGIGGLAFALAAQDTLANIFGAIVVAVDQPFKIGEVVRIGANVGGVEDIGLRSTRIRLVDKSLMVIPNKTVAAETITNLSRFTQRRSEQVIGLTYDSKPGQMDEIVEEFRKIILAEPEVDPTSVMVFFRDFNASSLDIWVVYVAKDPDFQKFMRLRQRNNLAFMRAVEARGLSFAFPTQTVHLAGEVAEKLATRREPEQKPPATNP